jgi:hypothetical protein
VTGAVFNRLASSATTHCLTGCGIGEILGLAIDRQRCGHQLEQEAAA